MPKYGLFAVGERRLFGRSLARVADGLAWDTAGWTEQEREVLDDLA